MNVLSDYHRLISVGISVMVLASCSTTSVAPSTTTLPASPPEEQSIKILLGAHDMSHCAFKGDVSAASSVNAKGEHPPYTERLIGARNDLRKKTYQLGANTVHVTRTWNTGRYEMPGDQKVAIAGKAYFCEES